MSKLLRYYAPGHTYFLTVVTHKRQPILLSYPKLLLWAWAAVRPGLPHTLHAWVLMPDHFHIIISSPNHYPDVLVKRFKLKYRSLYQSRTGYSDRLWQHRFWDHIIRNEEDLQRRFDYIHYNPVKHGLSGKTVAWKWSSFGDFVRRGLYSSDWGDSVQEGSDGDYGDANDQ